MIKQAAVALLASTAFGQTTTLELEGSDAQIVLDVSGSSPIVVNKDFLNSLSTDAERDAAIAAYADSKAQVDAKIAAYANSKAEVDSKIAAYSNSKAEVDSKIAAYSNSKDEVDSKIAAYANSKAEVDAKIDALAPNLNVHVKPPEGGLSAMHPVFQVGPGRIFSGACYALPDGYDGSDVWQQLYFTVKTPMRSGSGAMYRYKVELYEYGSGRISDIHFSGYAYGAEKRWPIADRSTALMDAPSMHGQYYGSDGFLRLHFGPYTRFYTHFQVSFQGHAGSSGNNVDGYALECDTAGGPAASGDKRCSDYHCTNNPH